MEPEAINSCSMTQNDLQTIAVVSIAYSLKRIADLVEGNPHKTGLLDAVIGIMHKDT